MYASDTNDPLLDMIDAVSRDVLARLGDDPTARFEYVALAKRFADYQPPPHGVRSSDE